jgi:RNA polymerase sigma-70 factor (ECF subfamily)
VRRVRGPDRTDEQLLTAMAAGDADAFDTFYARHLADLTGFFMRRVRSRELAFDLVAETFAVVITAHRDFDPARGSAGAWLFGIAANKLRESARRGQVEARARRRLAMEPIALSEADLDAVDGLAGTTSEAALQAALGDLTAPQREAIWSRVVQERPYEEIARAMRCSQAVVRQRVSRGLARMRRELAAG